MNIRKGVIAMCVVALAGSAFAEESPSWPADTVRLEEVNVTAIKQGTNLSNRAVAYSEFSRAELERNDATALKSLSELVPNLYIPDYGSRITSSIYVRGLGARMDQPVMGLNVDNVPVLNKDAYDFDVEDLVSATIVRGPQSALYGRNTMGGVITLTTLSPFDFQGWRAVVKGGNGGVFKGNVSYYAKTSRKFAFSLSTGWQSAEGFFTNQYNGKKLDKERMWSGRAKIEWRPSGNFTLQNTLSLSNLHQGGYPYESVETGTIATNDTCMYRRFLLSDGLTMRWRLGKVKLSSVTSLQHINDNMTLDQDFLPIDYFTLTQKKRETSFTQDFLATGEAGESYSWLGGAFGFYKHLHMLAPVTFYDYGITHLIEHNRNEVNPDYPVVWDTRSFVLHSDFTNPTYGLALYHQSRYDSGRWHLMGGLRLDFEHASLDYRSRCNTSYTIYHPYPDPYRQVPIDIDDTGRLTKSFVELLPQLGIVYDLGNGDSNLYLDIAKGYKAGGFNTQMFSDVLQQRLMGMMGLASSYSVEDVVEYKPEKSWNFEVGSHFRFPKASLSGSAALFYILCTDQQLTMFPDGNTTGRIMTNAGRTRSFGVELSLRWTPLEQWHLAASYGYTNAKFLKFDNGIADYKGKYLPYAPGNTISVSTGYSLGVGRSWLSSIRLDADLKATGKIYWNEANTLSQPVYALLGANLTFEGPHYSLQLWGENLTATKYYTFYFVSIGNEFIQRGRPVQFGATLRLTI